MELSRILLAIAVYLGKPPCATSSLVLTVPVIRLVRSRFSSNNTGSTMSHGKVIEVDKYVLVSPPADRH